MNLSQSKETNQNLKEKIPKEKCSIPWIKTIRSEKKDSLKKQSTNLNKYGASSKVRP